jgi:hypothetical protein
LDLIALGDVEIGLLVEKKRFKIRNSHDYLLILI